MGNVNEFMKSIKIIGIRGIFFYIILTNSVLKTSNVSC